MVLSLSSQPVLSTLLEFLRFEKETKPSFQPNYKEIPEGSG